MMTTCPECRHPLPNAPGITRCQNCGTSLSDAFSPQPVTDSAEPPTGDRPRRLASIVAFVASLLVFIPFASQLVAIGAGGYALARPRLERERVGMARAGVVISLVVLAMWLAAIVFNPSFLLNGSVTTTNTPGRAPRMPAPPTKVPDYSTRELSSELADVMTRIQGAASAYRRDYGQWPADMSALRGNYLPGDYELPEQLTFYGLGTSGADPDAVLLRSTPLEWDLSGNVVHASPQRLIIGPAGGVRWEVDTSSNDDANVGTGEGADDGASGGTRNDTHEDTTNPDPPPDTGTP